MTNQQILETAIQKAIDGGWKIGPWDQWRALTDEDKQEFYKTAVAGPAWKMYVYDHDFAKALWGERPYERKSDNYLVRDGRRAWMVHLQQMVIADDPIKYLGEHL